ncbi:hypothetical protein MHU86_20977 [Fragilaria crotonensis]|nr:hypothetical protein MHU86_20977 [Fragilaria crotonensis]
MAHFPSLLVGGAVASTGFLFIHQQLSYRTRLSRKWPLQEWAEHEAREIMSWRGSSKLVNSDLSGVNTTIIDSWNKTLKSVQKALAAPPRKES